MAPRQKEIIVYYDFSDVIASASSVSSLSLGSSLEFDYDDSNHDHNNTDRQVPRRRRLRDRRNPEGKQQQTKSSKQKHSYSLRMFDLNNYNDVEHVWDKKPFVVRTFPTLGRNRCDKLKQKIHRNRARLSLSGCWDEENLVMTDARSAIRSKVYFAVKNVQLLPAGAKVEYLSGTWLSKVFVGDHEDVPDWVDTTAAEVEEKYNATPSSQWFAFYPTEAQHPRPAGYTVVAFFIKISD